MEKKIEDIEDKIEVRMRDCGPEHFEEETDRYEDVWEGEVKQVVNYRWYKKGYGEPEVLYLNEVVEKLEMELVGLGLSEKDVESRNRGLYLPYTYALCYKIKEWNLFTELVYE